MNKIALTISSETEFFESKRLFCLAFLPMLNKMGSDYTKYKLNTIFSEATFSLFPDNLTPENLEATVMNFKIENVKFK
ncbi:hypothetical protein [Maribacter stanieri]|uniref:hypothetical protein n=1 Tax=Maribacter stanieri TaxID=440514 RepID=UPI0030DB1700|tara:strand:- start:6 stop:239 length:234 start_codon:yes stop_codon:yes gene_type:complete